MKIGKNSSLALCLLASACGGDSGNPGGGSVVVPPPVTPTPTPAPSFSYFQLDLARSFSLPALSSGFQMQLRYTQDTPPFYTYQSGAATIGDLGSATITWNPDSGQFAPVGLDPVFTRADRYPDLPANGTTSLSYLRDRTGHPTLADYNSRTTAGLGPAPRVRHIFLGSLDENASYFPGPGRPKEVSDSFRTFLTGTPTHERDMPATGAMRYNTDWSARLVSFDKPMPFGWYGKSIDVDFAARTVRADVLAEQTGWITGTEPLKVQLRLDAALDPRTGRITGTLRSADGGFDGTVLGYLFGPQAAEIGMAIRMTDPIGRPIGGVLVGAR